MPEDKMSVDKMVCSQNSTAVFHPILFKTKKIDMNEVQK
jgi:hypothetical protein